uniref:Uncharacterized protein n=1 Tax=Oryza rufipogon TaxID=4529 RepID=A0A0E0PDT5_ORYRU
MMITASGPPCRSRGRGDTGGDHRRLPPSSTSPPPEQTTGNRAAARKAAAGPSFSLEGAGRCPRPQPVGGRRRCGGIGVGVGALGWARGGDRGGTAGRRRLGAEQGRRRRRRIWCPSPDPAVRPPPGTMVAPKEAGKGDAGGGKGGAAATRVASPDPGWGSGRRRGGAKTGRQGRRRGGRATAAAARSRRGRGAAVGVCQASVLASVMLWRRALAGHTLYLAGSGRPRPDHRLHAEWQLVGETATRGRQERRRLAVGQPPARHGASTGGGSRRC